VSGPVVIAAGGTGGHMFPAEALAAELVRRGCPLALVTDQRGGGYGETLGRAPTHVIRAGQVLGRGIIGRLLGLGALALGTFQAHRLLRRMRPRATVGFGGYAAFPTTLAACLAGIATVIHEQNAVLGRANRLLAGRVDRIATAFDPIAGLGTADRRKCVLTGNPVRPAIAAIAAEPYAQPEPGGPLNLLVLGGSQGAAVFSRVVPAAVAELEPRERERLRIAQQCRPEDLDRARQAYAKLGLEPDLASFFDDVPERLAAAHLLIVRAGASTVAECAAAGRPAILVPYPWAVDDHQTANAGAFEAAGGGWMMPEPAFTAEALSAHLAALLEEPGELAFAAEKAKTMGQPRAAEKLADLVLALAAPEEPAP